MSEVESHREVLHRTLAAADVSPSVEKSTVILRASGENADENRNLYQSVNRTLLKRLETRPLRDCTHITGEMRALSDKFHRHVLRQATKQQAEEPTVLFSLPRSDRNAASRILRWNRESWGEESSILDHLSAFDILSQGSIQLWAADGDPGVQYSLFDNELVLMQSAHAIRQHVKYVWFLQSEALHGILSKRADELIQTSESLSSGRFTRFNLNLSDPAAMDILAMLRDAPGLAPSELPPRLRGHERVTELLDDLDSCGFIERTRNGFQLARAGFEYLRYLGAT